MDHGVRFTGWLIFTFLFCDKMDKVNHVNVKGQCKMVPIISAGAMLGAFANLASGNFFTAEGSLTFTNAPAIATIAGCVIMMVLVKLSRARDIAWLREWHLQLPCSAACSSDMLSA